MSTAPAQPDELTDTSTESAAPIAGVEIPGVAPGASLSEYRAAKKAEALEPTAPISTKPETPASQEPKISKRQQQINDYERELATLRAENARLKTPPPAQSMSRPAADPPAAATTNDAYERYLTMADAPKLEAFSAAGKTYEQWSAAMNVFIADKRFEERETSARRAQTVESMRQREQTRGQRLQDAIKADTDIVQALEIRRSTGQLPTNAPISQDVLLLKPFSALKQGESATALNAIAEEVLESDNPVGLMKHLSKPGELARLAALPDARTLIREIGKIEDAIKAPAPKTETTVGRPAAVLTSARATDPLDPVESAIKRKDYADYKRSRMAERLSERGLK